MMTNKNMEKKSIEIELQGYVSDYISSISETLKLAKAYGDFIKVKFPVSGVEVFVYPESCVTDLCKIYNLECILAEYKKDDD